VKRLYLMAMPSHVGARVGGDVDGLASPLYRPMAHSCQAKGQGLSAKHYPILSLQLVVAPFRRCEASRAQIFDGELTALILVLLNITHGKSFLPGDAYPLVESS
jgi:hypothetical protein